MSDEKEEEIDFSKRLDLENLEKAAMDALNGIMWTNDVASVQLLVIKNIQAFVPNLVF